MPRIMTIWLPRWPVQRRLVERQEWRKRPVFVCSREKRGLMTVVSWAWAEPPKRRRAAIQPGMSLAEAMAVLALAYGSAACHAAEVDADDSAADAEALGQLARACRRFAPLVGVEATPAGRTGGSPREMTPAECLHLDVTGTAGFFGGEAALTRTAAWTLAARGLHARVAIADTPAAAWAAAHHTDLVARAEPRPDAEPASGPTAPALRPRAAGSHRRWAVVPPGAQRLRAGQRRRARRAAAFGPAARAGRRRDAPRGGHRHDRRPLAAAGQEPCLAVSGERGRAAGGVHGRPGRADSSAPRRRAAAGEPCLRAAPVARLRR